MLAPCTLPLLPIIIGGSLKGNGASNRLKPFIITASLALSIVVFTLLLKFSTALINIPQSAWAFVSGSIITFIGLIILFPELWEKVSIRFQFSTKSNKLLRDSAGKKNYWGDVLIGASLGPVFSSCSPTYFLILATVLPQDFTRGLVYLIAYALGLSLVLLLIAFVGQRFVHKIQWAADPKGWFKRVLGALFIVVGIFIFTGLDKKLQTYLINHGLFDVTKVEQLFLQNQVKKEDAAKAMVQAKTPQIYPKYREIQEPAGYVNTEGIKISDLVGKKVILLDFMTYSCINCIRTFPYLNAWYDKYEDEGLEVIGIHTPEFAFEHKRENVEQAMQKFGIKFPIVLDNEYGTWQAYGNNYWPRKYLIDIYGNVVYDHIGEGQYDETEKKIQTLLQERKKVLGLDMEISSTVVSPTGSERFVTSRVKSPEMYFGFERNQWLGNGTPESGPAETFLLPSKEKISLNTFYLGGDWQFFPEYAQNTSKDGKIILRYQADKVFFVASSEKPVKMKIFRDGLPVGSAAGSDVQDGVVTVQEDRLYRLIESENGLQEHTLEIQIEDAGLEAYTFTFG